MKALENRLEHEPLAHETRRWRHRRKAHRRKQSANPEQPMATGPAIGDVVAAACFLHRVRGEEERPFGERVTREVQERDDPREASQVVEMIGPEDQRGAERDDGDRGVLG